MKNSDEIGLVKTLTEKTYPGLVKFFNIIKDSDMDAHVEYACLRNGDTSGATGSIDKVEDDCVMLHVGHEQVWCLPYHAILKVEAVEKGSGNIQVLG